MCNLVRASLALYVAVVMSMPVAYAVNSAAKNTGVVTRDANGLQGMLMLTSDQDWQKNGILQSMSPPSLTRVPSYISARPFLS